jgi:hypothetical protein
MLKRVDRRLRKQVFMFEQPLIVHAGEEVLLTTKGGKVIKAEVVKAEEPESAQEELNRRIREENSG